jgi:glycerophosphoryl diester phosphodiesterase
VSERPFSQVGLPLIVAHRGASAEEAENTLAAFELAVEVGAGAVEFDVRMTADGAAVVMHDPDVDRTTDGTGLVRSMSLAEIGRLRIRTEAGGSASIPTLREVLDLLSGRAAVDIEIKNIPGEADYDGEREAAVEAVHAALAERSFVGEVIVSSFNPLSIAASRALDPSIPTGLLTEHRVDARAALAFAADHGHQWILPFAGKVFEAGPTLSDDVHAAGMLLGTWITDDPKEAVTLLQVGVDAVATNDPRHVVPARAEVVAAFHDVLDEIEPAKAGLADVLPSTRLPGRPLNDAVEAYLSHLRRAVTLMAAWRCPEVESIWHQCSHGLDVGIDRAQRLQSMPEDPVGFEGLLGTVEQLLDPLDPFAAAEEGFRHLRRRPVNGLVRSEKHPLAP